MAGRAPQRPTGVAALSVAAVNDPSAQRAFEQTADAVQVLQVDVRRQRADAEELAATVTALTATVDALPGRFLGLTSFAASGTYTPNPAARIIRIRATGGGGGGGGASGGANSAAGGGGASGVYQERTLSNPDGFTGGAVTIGAGGAGGSVAGGTGSTGGSTSFVIDGITYTLLGGLGGAGAVNAVSTFAEGAKHSAGSTSGADLELQGTGLPGININGYAYTGEGGSNPFGDGAAARDGASGAGLSGRGFGGGGGGALTGAAGQLGGAGAPSLIIFEEYT